MIQRYVKSFSEMIINNKGYWCKYSDVEKIEQENEILREIKLYNHHLGYCAKSIPGNSDRECKCGLDKLLKELEEK